MSIFAVIPTGDATPILTKANTLGLQLFKLPKGEFLVSFGGTSKELSEALGIADGSSGNAVVLAVSSYHGRTTPDTWEWMTKNWGG